MATTNKDTSQCFFLKLPLEVRLLIYKYTQHTEILGSGFGVTDWFNDPEPKYSHSGSGCRSEGIDIDGAPMIDLLTVCSTIRDEYTQFCYPFVDIQFRYEAIFHREIYDMESLSWFLVGFGSARQRDSLYQCFCNLPTLTLTFMLPDFNAFACKSTRKRSMYQLTDMEVKLINIEHFLEPFSRLKLLRFNIVCDAEWYSKRRAAHSPDTLWDFMQKKSDFEERFPDLVIRKQLTISSKIAEGPGLSEDDWDDFMPDVERIVRFKATPTTSPSKWAWEGLDLEQIESI